MSTTQQTSNKQQKQQEKQGTQTDKHQSPAHSLKSHGVHLESNGRPYGTGIYLDFRDYHLSLHHKSSADYPTDPDITSISDQCGEHRYAMPLRAVLDAACAHDNNKKTGSNVCALPMSGILFGAIT